MKLPTIAILASVIIATACSGSGIRQQAVAADTVAEPVIRKISLSFSGDLMQHLPQVMAAKRDTVFDYTECFRYIRPFYDSTDLVVVNLETTLTDDGNYTGYPLFGSPTALAGAMKEAGIDIAVTANNHCCDRGYNGLVSTINALDEAGIAHTGTFADSAQYIKNHPLIIERNGFRFAFLSYTYGTNGLPIPKGTIVNLIDTTRISADLKTLKSRNDIDFTIIYYHWGEEYLRIPTKHQRELALWSRDRGADFVIGSHPHVIGPVELIGDSLGSVTGITAYSLGNLISNQTKLYTDGGLTVKINLSATDSLPADIRTHLLFHWIYNRIDSTGRRQYSILPSYTADSVIRDQWHKIKYERFIKESLIYSIPDTLTYKKPD